LQGPPSLEAILRLRSPDTTIHWFCKMPPHWPKAAFKCACKPLALLYMWCPA